MGGNFVKNKNWSRKEWVCVERGQERVDLAAIVRTASYSLFKHPPFSFLLHTCTSYREVDTFTVDMRMNVSSIKLSSIGTASLVQLWAIPHSEVEWSSEGSCNCLNLKTSKVPSFLDWSYENIKGAILPLLKARIPCGTPALRSQWWHGSTALHPRAGAEPVMPPLCRSISVIAPPLSTPSAGCRQPALDVLQQYGNAVS